LIELSGGPRWGFIGEINVIFSFIRFVKLFTNFGGITRASLSLARPSKWQQTLRTLPITTTASDIELAPDNIDLCVFIISFPVNIIFEFREGEKRRQDPRADHEWN
jgi:hypothetical protein